MPPGEYELGIGMLEPHSKNLRVRFAVEGRAGDGWYRLSRVRVR